MARLLRFETWFAIFLLFALMTYNIGWSQPSVALAWIYGALALFKVIFTLWFEYEERKLKRLIAENDRLQLELDELDD